MQTEQAHGNTKPTRPRVIHHHVSCDNNGRDITLRLLLSLASLLIEARLRHCFLIPVIDIGILVIIVDIDNITIVVWGEFALAPRAHVAVPDDDLCRLRVRVPGELPSVVAPEIDRVTVQILVDAGACEERDVDTPNVLFSFRVSRSIDFQISREREGWGRARARVRQDHNDENIVREVRGRGLGRKQRQLLCR